MNLIKQENDVKQSTTTELFIQMFGPAVSLAIGDPTGISAAAITVISKWGLERFLLPQFISKRSAT